MLMVTRFIQAESSRSPLDCSKPMLEYLLSFHQVSPSFLELVFAFGKGTQPEDFHYTGFRHESFLNKAEAEVYAIYRLGRSGREIKQSYNLWSVEESSSEGGTQPWSIRQTAVYHSFDLDAGRAFWINIKANNVLKSRTTAETASLNRLCAHTISDPGRCFAATLTTHLIHFEWCRENWRMYLSSLKKRLDDILKMVSGAPVERVERALAVDGNALIRPLKSGSTPPSRANTFDSAKGVFSRQSTGISTIAKSVLSTSPTPVTAAVQNSASIPPANPSQQSGLPSVQENEFGVLDQFSIEELQRLHRIGKALQEASLVMRLNADVLLEISQSYDDLINDDRFPDTMRSECSTAIHDFFQQSRCIIKELEREQRRITTLIQMMENGKTMVRQTACELSNL